MSIEDTRWLNAEKTAAYLSVRIDALSRLVKQRRIPAPDYSLGPRSPRWDRKAIDAILGAKDISSTDPRIAVRAHVEKIIAQGRQGGPHREAHARRRDG